MSTIYTIIININTKLMEYWEHSLIFTHCTDNLQVKTVITYLNKFDLLYQLQNKNHNNKHALNNTIL